MYDIKIPVLMGLESIVGDELLELGYPQERIVKEDALVTLKGTGLKALARDVARCNIYLRTAERVEVELESFMARDFDELFDQVQELPWEMWIPERAAFTIKGYSRKSKLFAPTAIQSTIKKGIVLALQEARGLSEDSFIEEDRDYLDLRINYAIMDDQVSLRMDTSGDGLHKRGYRKQAMGAPIRETLAAAILYISMWSPESGEAIYDPCCGSGTILAEAALMAANIAPGIKRSFRGEEWPFIGKKAFEEVRREARAMADKKKAKKVKIAGSDLDPYALEVAEANFRRAGITGLVDLEIKDLHHLSFKQIQEKTNSDQVLLVANPPYGERLETGDEELVKQLNNGLADIAFYPDTNFTWPGCRMSVITSANFQDDTGHRADKRRKLYNGMIETTLYHYFRQKYLD